MMPVKLRRRLERKIPYSVSEHLHKSGLTGAMVASSSVPFIIFDLRFFFCILYAPAYHERVEIVVISIQTVFLKVDEQEVVPTLKTMVNQLLLLVFVEPP